MRRVAFWVRQVTGRRECRYAIGEVWFAIVLNRFAPVAGVCAAILFGAAPLASADPLAKPPGQQAANPAAPPPDNGLVESGPPGVLDAPDGCVLTVVGSDESEVRVAPVTGAITSREYVASGTFTGTVTCR
jgi:hypothetical protein